MKQPDNWGWKARIGMFIVSVEAVPEAEWWAMLPPGVSLHIARVTATTPWAKWSSSGEELEFQDDLARGATQFAAMHLSAVLIGHTSSSIIGMRNVTKSSCYAPYFSPKVMSRRGTLPPSTRSKFIHQVLACSIFAPQGGHVCLLAFLPSLK